MELILIAIVAMVVLAGVDADRWPRTAPRARRSHRVVRRARPATARPAARRRRAASRPAPAYTGSTSRLCLAPRWWWE